MDGKIGSVTIFPDQMGIVNPLLILALVPVFESVIYPCFRKCGLLTPLQRIGAGGIITGLAFVISGFIELSLEVCGHISDKNSRKGIIRLLFSDNLRQDTERRIDAIELYQYSSLHRECQLCPSWKSIGQVV